MKVEKIKVDQASLARLMVDMREGRLRVPRFQRDFVWERKRIQELLDSMYKEYPIGTIFLWEAPHKYNHLLRNVEYLQQPAIEIIPIYGMLHLQTEGALQCHYDMRQNVSRRIGSSI